jgi:hypothetical protein
MANLRSLFPSRKVRKTKHVDKYTRAISLEQTRIQHNRLIIHILQVNDLQRLLRGIVLIALYYNMFVIHSVIKLNMTSQVHIYSYPNY